VNQFRCLFGDQRRLLQILLNFLSNALKFSYKESKILVELRLNECVKIDRKQRKFLTPSDSQSMLLDKRSTHYVNFDLIV
jgi:signal transduction histidine kinase